MDLSPHHRRRIASIALVVAALAVTACSGRSPGDENAPPGELADSGLGEASSVADVVTWALSSEPRTLDWRGTASGSDLTVTANVCEGLLSQDVDGTIVPNLAESLEHPDPTTYIFTLRDDVKFSDGTPMTAQDVAYSFNAIVDPSAGSLWGFYASGAEAKVVNDEQVRIELESPNALFERAMTTPLGWVNKAATVRDEGSQYGTSAGAVTCTGPYLLDQWESGEKVTLIPNPHWWGPAESRKVWNRGVKFIFLNDPSTLAAALQTDGADGGFQLPGTTYQALAEDHPDSVASGPSLTTYGIVPLDLSGALEDVRMRRAVAKLVDYDGIADTIYRGLGEVTKTPVSPATWSYAADTFEEAYDRLPEVSQDLDGAKALADEAGNPKVTLAVLTSSAQGVPIAESIASAADQAGMNLEIKTLSDAQFASLNEDPENSGYDAMLTNMPVDFADPLDFYAYNVVPDTYGNLAGYDNPEVTRLLAEAMETEDEQERAELVVQAQERVVEDVALIPVVSVLTSAYLRPGLAGAEAAIPTNFFSPWAARIGEGETGR